MKPAKEKKSETTLKVRFLADAEIKNGAGDVIESYKAGAVEEMRIDRARRWVTREKAVVFQPDETPKPEAPPKPQTDPTVDIPANWATLHWKAQAALAQRLTGKDAKNAAEARDVIDAEVKRREAIVKPEAPPSPDAGFAKAQETYRQAALDNDDGA